MLHRRLLCNEFAFCGANCSARSAKTPGAPELSQVFSMISKEVSGVTLKEMARVTRLKISLFFK
jgi:hypothetical protein